MRTSLGDHIFQSFLLQYANSQVNTTWVCLSFSTHTFFLKLACDPDTSSWRWIWHPKHEISEHNWEMWRTCVWFGSWGSAKEQGWWGNSGIQSDFSRPSESPCLKSHLFLKFLPIIGHCCMFKKIIRKCTGIGICEKSDDASFLPAQAEIIYRNDMFSEINSVNSANRFPRWYHVLSVDFSTCTPESLQRLVYNLARFSSQMLLFSNPQLQLCLQLSDFKKRRI